MPDGRGAGFSRREAALVFLVALLPRLAHFWFVRHTPLADEFVPDLSAYLFLTARLMDSAFFFVQPMLMSPGYSFVLAPQYILFGPNVPVFVLVNAVLDAGSAALCGLLAARLVPVKAPAEAPDGRRRAAGLAAGLGYALCGQLLFYALLPLGEGPAIFCLLGGLALLFGAGESPALRPWLAGALLALAALIRPNLAPAEALALAAWALAPGADRRGRLAAAARCGVAMLLVFLPFMAHNLSTAGRATPFGFQGGVTLYAANHPEASGVGEALAGLGATPYESSVEAWTEARRLTGRPLNLAEADAFWYAKAWGFLAENPGEAARLLGRKLLLLFNPGGLDSTADMDFSARFSPVPGWLPLPLGLVFALAAAGLWRALFGPGRGPESFALAGMLAAVAGGLLLFLVTPRYRVVLLPLALCLAGAFAAEAPALLRGPRKALLGPALCLGIALGLSLVPLRLLVDGSRREGLEHARLARFYLLKGPVALAPAEYLEALRLGAPDPAALRAGLAASLLLSGQGPDNGPDNASGSGPGRKLP
jgi:hypothetical protein